MSGDPQGIPQQIAPEISAGKSSDSFIGSSSIILTGTLPGIYPSISTRTFHAPKCSKDSVKDFFKRFPMIFLQGFHQKNLNTIFWIYLGIPPGILKSYSCYFCSNFCKNSTSIVAEIVPGRPYEVPVEIIPEIALGIPPGIPTEFPAGIPPEILQDFCSRILQEISLRKSLHEIP